MTKRDDHKRYSRHVTSQPRWKALRLQALERDDWKCRKCGTRQRLEVDHVEPVRTRPDLAWTLSNLQVLCGRCHAYKTRIEMGLKPISPERHQWRTLLREQLFPLEGPF